MTPARIDTLIYNGPLLTVDPAFSIIENGAVAIVNGAIDRVWSLADDPALPAADQELDVDGDLIMPGLVNAHTHLPMTLFRGMADDLPLDQWLNEYMFPAEARYVRPDSVRCGTLLACAELLIGGTTCCCDGYFLADHIAETVRHSGLRAVLAQGVIDFPAPGVTDPAANITVAAEYLARWQGRHPLIRPSVFCHSPYTCSADTLKAAKALARDNGALFQIHLAETRAERRQMHDDHGGTPVRRLADLGLLDADTLLVHAIWLDDDDIAAVAASRAAVVHCPESNMKLASGVAPVPAMQAAGICVGLGTDGSASNNDLDMFREMDTAAKLHKVHLGDPTVLDAATVVKMATIEGARAIGMERQIGSLEAGKRADITVLDLSAPHLMPLYHPASQVVYAANGGDVRHVMVDGRWVVRDRQLKTIDLPAVLVEASQWGARIAQDRETMSN